MSATSSTAPKRPQQTSILNFMSSPLTEFNKMKPLATSTPMVPRANPKTSLIRKRKLAPTAEEDTSQMVLDAGQKKIGIIGCDECGMFYNVDVQKDVKTHTDYHNRFEKSKLFHVDSRSSNAWFKKLFNKHITGQINGTVIRLKPDEKSTLRTRVDNIVKECIDPQIGIAEDVPAFSKDKKQDAFVFIADATDSRGALFAACVLIEKVMNCKLMPERMLFHATDADRCFLAVERLWVHPSLRKQYVATSLLDVVREVWSPPGFMFKRTRIAFCDPTPGCIEFAKKYLDGTNNKNQWIAYDPENAYGCRVKPGAGRSGTVSASNAKAVKLEKADVKVEPNLKKVKVEKPIKHESGTSEPSTSTSSKSNNENGKPFPKRRRCIDPNMLVPTVTITDDDKEAEISMERYNDD